MNTFVCLAALVAVAFAGPVHHVNVAEDTLGNYKLDFDLGDQTKVEDRRDNGFTSGVYTYVDLDGVKHTVKYSGGEQGFVVESADVPVAPQDTLENVQARNHHAAIFNSIKANPSFQESPTDNLELPITPAEFISNLKTMLAPSVEDTPDIAAAKVDLFNAYAKAL